jgi:hypothetical protein
LRQAARADWKAFQPAAEFYLAMCQHHFGAPAEARARYDRALRVWRDQAPLPLERVRDLKDLQAEAEAVLGLPHREHP